MLIIWKPEYATGFADVDFEHQELIRLINQLDASIREPQSREEIEEFLGELHAMISAHFALEEQAMARAAYAEFTDHKADHEKLLEEIRDMMEEFEADPGKGRERLRAGLGDWFGRHFSSFDARLHKAGIG